MILNKKTEKLLNNLFISRLPLPVSSKKLTAFTLAEVLITLLIIGIVASLVIPAIISDTQKQEDYTRLLKAVSVVQNAANLIRMENGGRMTGLADSACDLANLFAPKLNYIKFCTNSTTSPNCYISNSDNMYNLHGEFYGGYSPYSYLNSPKIVTNDGFVYIFILLSSTCQNSHYTIDGISQNCGIVFVDINGKKPPNTHGHDIFQIYINDHNTIAAGNSGSTNPIAGCQLPSTNVWNGNTCTGRAIMEGGIKYY